MPQIHLDDFTPGQVHHLGERTLSRDEIVAFARDWDPQPFHLDEQAAAASIYGGLIASGWHTVCAFMRLFADGLLNRAAAMGSPGIDELRWLQPVRPGDRLDARLEVLEVRPSRSKPDRGIVRLRCVMANQHEEEGAELHRQRNVPPAAGGRAGLNRVHRRLPAIEPPGSSDGQTPSDPVVGQPPFCIVRRYSRSPICLDTTVTAEAMF
jgi:acyl dehydratase